MRFLAAVKSAIAGIVYGLRTQRHLRFHLLAGSAAILLGCWKGLSITQWMVLTMLIAVVVAAELLNTAIETVVDLVSPDRHPLAGIAKDTAAGAVLVVALGALVIALLLFLPPAP